MSGDETIQFNTPGGRAAPPPYVVAVHFPQLDDLEIVGQGGMGAVYKARQKGLDRMVALKILPPAEDSESRFAERFSREAKALARLDHPNIVTVHDSGKAGDLYYLMMEYVDGMNLRQMMESGKLEPEQALAIIPPICDALQYAHDEGVMHRDIKPENILIDRRGRVKIADFGLAKLTTGRATDYTMTALTAPQQVMGTLHYMAPEQFERPADVDHRADIYALGVVLYELLTGELPLGRFPLPSEKSDSDPRLDEVVIRSLEKEPDRRYQRVEEVKTDIEMVTGNGVAPPVAPAMPPFAAPPGTASTSLAQRASNALGNASTGNAIVGVLKERHIPIAYLCWFAFFLGAGGIHRMYAGKWITGVLWLLTGGCFAIGQFIDLFLIPKMIRIKNLETAILAKHYANMPQPAQPAQPARPTYPSSV